MEFNIDNFSILKDIDKTKIIRFYIYNDLSYKSNFSTSLKIKGKNVIFITENDEVYGFGENTRGCLGVKPFKPYTTPQLMNDICKKKIINFYNGTHHVFARTSNKQIYCWGYNKVGQLGIEPSSTDSFTPQKNRILSEKNIHTICCGEEHSIALTKDGAVYAWGNNKFGQVGDDRSDKFVLSPTNLSLKNSFYGVKVCAISCGSNHSMALTSNKTVFSWGHNDFGQLGIGDLKERRSPYPLRFKNVKKISCGQKSSMVITEDGFLHIFGRSYLDGTDKKQVCPIPYTNSITFKNVISHINFDIFVGLSKNGFCYEFGKIQSDFLKMPNETNETALLMYYANVHKITLKAIETKKLNEEVNEEEYLITNPDSTSNSGSESVAELEEQTQRSSEEISNKTKPINQNVIDSNKRKFHVTEQNKSTNINILVGDLIKSTLVDGALVVGDGNVNFSSINQTGKSN